MLNYTQNSHHLWWEFCFGLVRYYRMVTLEA
jgi:hypothetical protein